MVQEAGQTEDNIKKTTADLFTDDPFLWDFYMAARLIECLDKDKPLIGETKRSKDDPIFFGQHASLKFPSSTVDKLVESDDKADWLYVNFLGLLGSQGPMPLGLTEKIYLRVRNHRDKTMESFLNIFNHRMISLYYRAWANVQQTVCYDRPGEDKFANYIKSLFGTGLSSMQDRDALPDKAKLYYSGHLSSFTANKSSMEAFLSEYFEIPVVVEEFIGRWVDIPYEDQSRIGESAETGLLGQTMVIGSKTWECQSKFRLTFGPMNLEDFERMLPSQEALERLKAWVKNYVGLEFEWEVNLILKKEEIPPTKLGESGQLGWTTWMGKSGHVNDSKDLMLGPF